MVRGEGAVTSLSRHNFARTQFGPRVRGPESCDAGNRLTGSDRSPVAMPSFSAIALLMGPSAVAEARAPQLRDLEVFCRGLAPVADQLVLDALTFVERTQAGALHRRDVYEHVLATVGRLDEAVAFGRIEPLHSSASHFSLLMIGAVG